MIHDQYELESAASCRSRRLQPFQQMSVPTPVLFVPKPRLEGRVPVMREKLSFGIGLPV